MNSGFLTRAREIDEERRESYGSNRPNELGIWRHIVPVGVPNHFKVLNENWLELDIHFPGTICQKMYYQRGDSSAFCAECEKPGFEGRGKNIPRLCRVLLGYVYENVNQVRKSNKGTEYKLNPVSIIEIPAGEGQKNFSELDSAKDGGYLLEEVWKLKRVEQVLKSGKKRAIFETPTPASTKRLGQQFNLELPDSMDKFTKLPRNVIFSILLSVYNGVDYDNEELKQLGIKKPEEIKHLVADSSSDENNVELDEEDLLG